MIEYTALKAVHVGCVVASYVLFFIRGVWMIRDSPMLDRRWVKVVPHLNDTALIGAAISLAWMLRQYPFVDAWLTAKVLALAAYIALGMIAIRPGRSKSARIAAWVAAQFVFLYIVAVARTHNPLVFTLAGAGGLPS